jgi:hypothetical protein
MVPSMCVAWACFQSRLPLGRTYHRAQSAMGRQLGEVGAAYAEELEAIEAALMLVRPSLLLLDVAIRAVMPRARA